MIVGARPRLQQIIIEIWKPLTILFVWDVIVTVFHIYAPIKEPPLPVALFGTAIGLFLGFRTNAAYARWWEARTLWGALINASRSIARISRSAMPSGPEYELIILRQIAFAHAMRCRLRGQDPTKDIERIAGTEAAEMANQRSNRPNAILENMSRIVGTAQAEGKIDTIQQSLFEKVMIDIANAQGGMERIKNTPLPNGFEFLPNLFTRLFCVLLPISLVESLNLFTPIGSTLIGMIFLAALRIGHDLTDPFANTVHDVPLSTMCRTIEIDLLESLGRKAPEPLAPVHGTQW
jgi:putative membrane protein